VSDSILRAALAHVPFALTQFFLWTGLTRFTGFFENSQSNPVNLVNPVNPVKTHFCQNIILSANWEHEQQHFLKSSQAQPTCPTNFASCTVISSQFIYLCAALAKN